MLSRICSDAFRLCRFLLWDRVRGHSVSTLTFNRFTCIDASLLRSSLVSNQRPPVTMPILLRRSPCFDVHLFRLPMPILLRRSICIDTHLYRHPSVSTPLCLDVHLFPLPTHTCSDAHLFTHLCSNTHLLRHIPVPPHVRTHTCSDAHLLPRTPFPTHSRSDTCVFPFLSLRALSVEV